jgi:hypothetical protein
VFFRFRQADEQAVADAQNVYFAKIEHRKKYNPIEFPSCGSTFKNITEKDHIEKMLSVWPDMKQQVETTWHGKVSMGYTIKRLGLAGLTIGRGQISEKHANYLINLGEPVLLIFMPFAKSERDISCYFLDFILNPKCKSSNNLVYYNYAKTRISKEPRRPFPKGFLSWFKKRIKNPKPYRGVFVKL